MKIKQLHEFENGAVKDIAPVTIPEAVVNPDTQENLADALGRIEGSVPTKVSELENDKGYLTSHQDISGKLDSSVAAATYATKDEVSTGLNDKVDKVEGKQLSSEDFTSALKSKLESLGNYDDTTISQALEDLRSDFDELVSGDTTTAIKSFNEIVAFLEGIEDSQDLDSIIAGINTEIAKKLDKTGGTIDGNLTVNGELTAANGKFGNLLINKGSGTNQGTDTIEHATSGNALYMQYYHNGGINLCHGGGTVVVGIGSASSSSYKLHVDGSLGVEGATTTNGLLTANGGLVAKGNVTIDGNKAWHAGNDGSGSGLDADMLDGKHDGELTANLLKPQKITTAGSYMALYNSFLEKGDTVDRSWVSPTGGYTNGGLQGAWMAIMRISSDNSYYHDISFDINENRPHWRQVVNGVSKGWKEFAFTDANVASADKLSTPRNIWGQSFDGSGDVSGNLRLPNYTSIQGVHTDGTTVSNLLYVGDDNVIKIGSGTIPVCLYGNVGIGTTSPAYKLDVNGTGCFRDTSYQQKSVTLGSGIGIHSRKDTSTDGSAQGVVAFGYSGTKLGSMSGAMVAGDTLEYFYYGKDYNNSPLNIYPSGNISVGGLSDTNTLSVLGTLSVSGATTMNSTLTVASQIRSNSILYSYFNNNGLYLADNSLCYHVGGEWVGTILSIYRSSNEVSFPNKTSFTDLLTANGGMDITGRAITGSTTWASDYGQLLIYQGTTAKNKYCLGLTSNTDGYCEIQSANVGVGAIPLVLQKLGGEIGIGKTNPEYTLDVNGTLGVSGNTTISGTLTVGGKPVLVSGGLTNSDVTTALGYTPEYISGLSVSGDNINLASKAGTVTNTKTATVPGLSKISRFESYTTATTVASLNVGYRSIYVTLSANASLSASGTGTTYNGRSITAYVYTAAACTITIPTTGNYVSMCGSSYTTKAGGWVEFNLTCIDGKWHIAKLEQQ